MNTDNYITIRLTKGNEKLKRKLAKLAKADDRKLNNYLERILIKHVNEPTP